MESDNLEPLRKQMSRRELLRKAGDVAMAVATPTVLSAVLGPLAWEWGQNKWNTEELQQRIESGKKDIRDRYGVTVSITPGEFPLEDKVQRSTLFTKEVASLYIRFKALEGVRHVLSQYPPPLIRKHVREIRIVKDLEMVNSLGIVDTASGTIDYAKKLIVANVIPLLDTYFALLGDVPSKKTLHHEIAHLICRDIRDSDWKALHPGVEYLSFFAKGVRDEAAAEGFVRAHSMTSPGEDIATVAEVLLRPGSQYSDKLQKDTILNRKAEYLKNWFGKESDGLMDDTFWNDLKAGRVDEQYWQHRQEAR